MIKPGEIQAKDPIILIRLMQHTYHHVLVEIVGFVASEYGIYITDAWRKKEHSGDVHGTTPGRGIDARSRVYKFPLLVRDAINERWIYDPKRLHKQCCKVHDVGRGIHMHIQSHPNTVRRS